MVLIKLILFVLLLQTVQDIPKNEIQLASKLRSPLDVSNMSALSRYTYKVEMPNREIAPKFQFYKFEMLTVSQFVVHSTDWVGKDDDAPKDFEFTGFYNPEYASGLKGDDGEDYSMIMIQLESKNENVCNVSFAGLSRDLEASQ